MNFMTSMKNSRFLVLMCSLVTALPKNSRGCKNYFNRNRANFLRILIPFASIFVRLCFLGFLFVFFSSPSPSGFFFSSSSFLPSLCSSFCWSLLSKEAEASSFSFESVLSSFCSSASYFPAASFFSIWSMDWLTLCSVSDM